MKLGVTISQTDPETVWNGPRSANTEILEEHQVKTFLLSDGIEIENLKSEKSNVKEQLDRLNQVGGTILSCGTCIRSRDMQFEACPISAMMDIPEFVVGCDKILVFYLCNLTPKFSK